MSNIGDGCTTLVAICERPDASEGAAGASGGAGVEAGVEETINHDGGTWERHG